MKEFNKEQKNIIGKLRREYKERHGHFPDDQKSKLNCKVCLEEAQKRSEAIQNFKLN